MQRLNQKTVNRLTKGLITEEAELTFPENASVDELNCSLDRDGSRARRLGLELEAGATNSSFTVSQTEVFNTGEWRNAGGVSNLNLMVVQAGGFLYFYSSNEAPYSAQEQSYSVDLTAYQIPGKLAANSKCQFTSLAGILVVASDAIETIYLTLDNDVGTINIQQIEFRVRDFDWQSDVCGLTEKIPLSITTVQRKYDTLNAGWTGNEGTGTSSSSPLPGITWPVSNTGRNALEVYTNARTAYPPLTHPWYSGKNSNGNFDLSDWEKIYAGSSIIGNGRFILNFFRKDRTAASGVEGLAVEVEPNRFKTVTSYAGRIWYAGLAAGQNSGKILYSRIVETIKDTGDCTVIGECYQQNDPTSEYFSDLLDTDGGVITIQGAENIRKLHVHNQYLYVFAENGVWIIGGTEDRFSPGSYFVSKITNVGIFQESSFVAAEGVPFWWSKYGIHTFTFDETSGYPMEQNVSIGTIQRLWDGLDVNAKQRVTASYDPINKRIFWLYPENGESLHNKYRKVLILDIPLGAFYPWLIGDNQNYVMGLYFFDGYGDALVDVFVKDSTGDNVVDSSLDEVTVTRANLLLGADTQLAALIFDSTSAKMTVGLFSSKTFYDWGNVNYDSYFETGYDFGGDLMLKKTAPYIVVYCRSTEEGYTGNESIGYQAINPSSLTLKAYWDFKHNPSSSQQAYRPKPYTMVNTTDLSDNNQDRSVVTTRLKVRGSGRSMRMRFESEEGKNFVFLGYGVIIGANDRF